MSVTEDNSAAVMATEESEMRATEDNSAAVMATEETSGSVIAAKLKKPMKVKAKAKFSRTKTGNPPYVKMVTDAIMKLKERKGSSRQAILKYVLSKYKVDVAVAQPRVNRTLKKLIEKGELVAGAKPGSSGAGCYKLSQETKKALMKEITMAARKKGLEKDAGGKKSGAGKTVAKTSAKGKMAKNSAKGKKIAIKANKKAVTKIAKGKKGDKKKISGVKTVAKKKAAMKIAKGKKGDKNKNKISGGKTAAKPKKVAKKGIKGKK